MLSLSVVSDFFVTPWTAVCQALLSTGILQARILEWVGMPSSREPSRSRNRAQVSLTAGRFFTIWDSGEAQTPVDQENLVLWLGRKFFQRTVTHLVWIICLFHDQPLQSGHGLLLPDWPLSQLGVRMVEEVLPFEGRGENLELFPHSGSVDGPWKYHCQAAVQSNLDERHSDHESKIRPVCVVVAEQLESWIFQG